MLAWLVFIAVVIALVVVVVDYLTGPPLHREVVIHTRKPDDQDIRGVLVRRNRRWIKLEAAKYLATPETVVDIEGDVLIPADNVAFIQAL